MLPKQHSRLYLVIGLFILYLVNGIVAIPRNSVTHDEMNHWSYGKRILKLQPEKIYPYADGSAMPVTALNALPRAVEQVLNPRLMKTDGGFSDIMHGRYVTLFICLLTGILIYKWAMELFGKTSALVSLFLFVFSPNLNAHAGLLTTDAYAALITLATTYFFVRFVNRSGWKNFLAFSLCLGIAQVTKYTLLHLVPIFFVSSLFILFHRKTLFSHWKVNLKRVTVLLAIVLAIINAAYLFRGTGGNIRKFVPYSHVFAQLQLSRIGGVPLPLPAPYIKGLDITIHMNELGGGDPKVSGQNYLLGEKKAGKGFPWYYLVVFLFKTPLVLLCLTFLAMLTLYRKSHGMNTRAGGLMIFIIFYFIVVLGFQNKVQIGIRHVLMIYPLLCVLAAGTTILDFFRKRRAVLYPILIVYTLAGFYYFFPNLLSYTNELIPDKKYAYHVMADSNLDFGQGQFSAAAFMKRNQDVNLAPETPRTGRFILSVNDYLDLDNSHRFSWLRPYKPSRQINHCYLLVEVPEKPSQ